MHYCDFLHEYSGKPRSEKCQSYYENKEEYEEGDEDTHLEPWVLTIRRCEYIRQSDPYSPEEESHCESHTVPRVGEHVRHAIPPEIDWEERHPEREEVED